jgi:hypothetical protein
VSSEPGKGSEFELTLPALGGAYLALPAGQDGTSAVIVDEDVGEDIVDREQQGSARR